MESIFIGSLSGELLIEKHFRGFLGRKPWDDLCDQITACGGNIAEVKPVVTLDVGGSDMHLVHVARHGLVYLAVVKRETPPAEVLTWLDRVDIVLSAFFEAPVNEDVIKQNFVHCYYVLDEMADFGMPNTTESNILTELISPPTMVGAIMGSNVAAGNIPEGALSNIPWRKSGVHYTNNEIFLDISETVNCIFDRAGMTVNTSVWGEIGCNCRLSGMPDLTLTFANGQLMDDTSFHPCVRYSRFARDRVVSFVPPDGRFTLMKYNVALVSTVQVPISVRPEWSVSKGSGHISIAFATRAGGYYVEDCVVLIPFPEVVNTVNISVNCGTFAFDGVKKIGRWDMPRVTRDKEALLTGTVQLVEGAQTTDERPMAQIDFKCPMLSASGIRVETLTMAGEQYRPYKGMRCLCKAGGVEIRM